ncbi:hypothetical protein D3C86_2089520 [compost metagenome]
MLFFVINVNAGPAFKKDNDHIAIKIVQSFFNSTLRAPFIKNLNRIDGSRNVELFTSDFGSCKKRPENTIGTIHSDRGTCSASASTIRP